MYLERSKKEVEGILPVGILIVGVYKSDVAEEIFIEKVLAFALCEFPLGFVAIKSTLESRFDLANVDGVAEHDLFDLVEISFLSSFRSSH